MFLLRRLIQLLGLTVLLSACAAPVVLPDVDELDHLAVSVSLDHVPFHPQDAYQCGPASLAMMLNYRGLADTPEALKERVYLPERRGSLQVELVAAARERDLLVYPLATDLTAILAELEAGNPVLVMQNLAYQWRPQWHYAVVIGYDLQRRELILHSGLHAARPEAFRVFMRTWHRADRWARVILPPGQLPATAEPLVYLRAASDLEQTGRFQAAQLAYEAGLQAWPKQPAARFGLGNVAWAQGRSAEALEHFRQLIRDFPGFEAGWHNLGVGLEAVGCHRAARAAKACASELGVSDHLPVDCPVPACPES